MHSALPTHLTASPIERVRAHLLKLPRVAETMQWGDNLVYWALDKAVGGKMFALMPAEPGEKAVIAFAAGPERKLDLLEHEGVVPAPYLARAHWVALQDWGALPISELLRELTAAHEYVFGRLPPRVQRMSELPLKEYKATVRACRAKDKGKS